MALTETTVIDKIEALPEVPCVQIREATRVERDGEVIASSYHRRVISQGDDYSSEPANVQAICNTVFGA